MTATLTDYDRMVSELVTKGVPRTKAEAAARTRLGLPDPALEVDADALEEAHVVAGDRLVLALGGRVKRFSQKKRAKVTPGIPDRRYYFPKQRKVFWWEAKAEWGRQSPDQRIFEEDCNAVGDPYVCGGLSALKAYLTMLGIATFDDEGRPHPIRPES